ncbi:MAG TPA: ABC transporter permease [Spirochaetia bacterium]|nr:ABC transporter permease [Spirochaetia bacterium]
MENVPKSLQTARANPLAPTIRRALANREVGVLLAFLVLVIVMSLASRYFLRPLNIFNVLRGMSTIAIMCVGVTMVIITGGIDLSVGSLLAVTGMFTARLMYSGVSPWLCVGLGFALGLGLGSLNGFIITKVRVNAFITTLGMMSIGRGFTYLLATGVQGTVASNIPMRDPSVNFIGDGYLGAVPFPIIEMILLVIVFSWFLRNTVLGRQIYAVGSNEEAARLSGVNVDRVKLFTYAATGVLCALAGIMSGGLLATAATNAGEGNELDVIAAVVIGGASLSGGVGTVVGAIIGAAIMAVLRNAFVLLHLPAFLQTVSIGVVIILAVASDNLRRRPGQG